MKDNIDNKAINVDYFSIIELKYRIIISHIRFESSFRLTKFFFVGFGSDFEFDYKDNFFVRFGNNLCGTLVQDNECTMNNTNLEIFR